MRISDWSSDVCSSDLPNQASEVVEVPGPTAEAVRESRYRMLEKLADFDDALMEKVLEEVEPERDEQIGRASCRERVCQYVEISVVAVSLKTKNKITQSKKGDGTT